MVDTFSNVVYLGDAVYAGRDPSGRTWIWTSNGIVESEKICLEPEVLEQLIRFSGSTITHLRKIAGVGEEITYDGSYCGGPGQVTSDRTLVTCPECLS